MGDHGCQLAADLAAVFIADGYVVPATPFGNWKDAALHFWKGWNRLAEEQGGRDGVLYNRTTIGRLLISCGQPGPLTDVAAAREELMLTLRRAKAAPLHRVEEFDW